MEQTKYYYYGGFGQDLRSFLLSLLQPAQPQPQGVFPPSGAVYQQQVPSPLSPILAEVARQMRPAVVEGVRLASPHIARELAPWVFGLLLSMFIVGVIVGKKSQEKK